MAGHSKWSNIKHRKGAQDLKRSKVFTKLIKEITIAAKIGGGDIDSNPRLRKAVNDSKSSNMPCLLYTSPSPRDVEESRMPSSA